MYGESLELLRELVSNAYDADAEHVWIDTTPTSIIIRDDGWGMNEDGLRQYCTIGSQQKREHPVSPRFRRPRIGQFGIGKFSALSACRRFTVETQQSDFRGMITFDKDVWSTTDTWEVPLERLQIKDSSDGTTVRLENLVRTFISSDIERFIRERLPLDAPSFSIILNGKSSRKFSFLVVVSLSTL